MKPKMLAFLVVLCLGLGLLAGKGFSTTARKTSADGKQMRRISQDVYPSEAAEAGAASGKYSTAGFTDESDCYNLLPDPEVPAVTEHELVGLTWYEYQHNGSMGRMISVGSGASEVPGKRHISWMWSGGPFPPGLRRVYARSKPLGGVWNTQQEVGFGGIYSGYSNQANYKDGTSVVIFHSTAAIGGRGSELALEDGPCLGSYGNKFDLPDDIDNVGFGEPGIWPKCDVLYVLDESIDPDFIDFIHIVEMEGNANPSAPKKIGYLRCYEAPGSEGAILICDSPGCPSQTVLANQTQQGPVASFDESCDISAVVVTGRGGIVRQRVAIVYMPLVEEDNCGLMHDVAYVESTNNGISWLTETDWPPTVHMVTDYADHDERAFHDLSACYDYNDSLHIVWVTAGFDPNYPGFYHPGVARLYHWSKQSGISKIISATYGDAGTGAHNLNIAKMSVSAKDPADHPDELIQVAGPVLARRTLGLEGPVRGGARRAEREPSLPGLHGNPKRGCG